MSNAASPTAAHPNSAASPTPMFSSLLRPHPSQPFGEYVVASLLLSSDTESARLAAACATLYLTRSDPASLQTLVHRFADLFPLWRDDVSKRITDWTTDTEEKHVRRLARKQSATPASASSSVSSLTAADGMSFGGRGGGGGNTSSSNKAYTTSTASSSAPLTPQLHDAVSPSRSFDPDSAAGEGSGRTTTTTTTTTTATTTIQPHERTIRNGGIGNNGPPTIPPFMELAQPETLTVAAASYGLIALEGEQPGEQPQDSIRSTRSKNGSSFSPPLAPILPPPPPPAVVQVPSASGPQHRIDEEQGPPLSDSEPRTPHSVRCLRRELIVEYFMAFVHQLLMQYFAYNWDQVDRVIKVNSEYRDYVEGDVIPELLLLQQQEQNSTSTPRCQVGCNDASLLPLVGQSPFSPNQQQQQQQSTQQPAVVLADATSLNQSLMEGTNTTGSATQPLETSSSTTELLDPPPVAPPPPSLSSYPSTAVTTIVPPSSAATDLRLMPIGTELHAPGVGGGEPSSSVSPSTSTAFSPSSTSSPQRPAPLASSGKSLLSQSTSATFGNLHPHHRDPVGGAASPPPTGSNLFPRFSGFPVPSSTTPSGEVMSRSDSMSSLRQLSSWQPPPLMKLFDPSDVEGFVTLTDASFQETLVQATMGPSAGGLVVLFHAPFSHPSWAMWNVLCEVRTRWIADLQKKQEVGKPLATSPQQAATPSVPPLPLFGVVHGISELELVEDFGVQWFPTLMVFRPHPSKERTRIHVAAGGGFHHHDAEEEHEGGGDATMSPADRAETQEGYDSSQHVLLPAEETTTTATTTTEEEPQQQPLRSQYVMFPEKGLVTLEAVEQWTRSLGTIAAPQRRFKAWVTRVAMLKTQLKFKPLRQLHSVCVMLKKLQCLGESCTRSKPTLADPPVFTFLGGGMAAGKTTAATALTRSSWWESHKDSAVVVDADQFKAVDPLAETSAMDVHRNSTKSAELLLLAAVNQGRSIIFDGTMMWRPFVEQTVAMIRDAHIYTFAMGAGYDEALGVEEYWVRSEKRNPPLEAPYRIHMLAITVEPKEAVPRGILRRLTTGRSVPIVGQLRSFRLFSTNFERYLQLCDEVTLYNNNVRVELDRGELPPVILRKAAAAASPQDVEGQRHAAVEGDTGLEVLDPQAYSQFLRHRHVNEHARSQEELFHVPAAAAAA